MKTDELLAVLTKPPTIGEICCLEEIEAPEQHEEGLVAIDDDDFWEAIDFLETAYKNFDHLLRYSNVMSKQRRTIIKALCKDISEFTSQFIVVEEK